MNTTLHIDHLDESVMHALGEMARSQHVTIEEAARRYLAQIRLSGSPKNGSGPRDKNSILDAMFGSWTLEEFEEFQKNTAPFRH